MSEIYTPLSYKTHFLAITIAYVLLLVILAFVLNFLDDQWGLVFFPYLAAVSLLFYSIFLTIIKDNAARQLIETKFFDSIAYAFLYGTIAPVIYCLATLFITGKLSSYSLVAYCGLYSSAMYLFYFLILKIIGKRQDIKS